MPMTVHDAAAMMLAATNGLARRGLWAEAHRLIEWLKGRPFIALDRTRGIDFDPWTELVLIEITQLTGQPRPYQDIRASVHALYRLMGIEIP